MCSFPYTTLFRPRDPGHRRWMTGRTKTPLMGLPAPRGTSTRRLALTQVRACTRQVQGTCGQVLGHAERLLGVASGQPRRQKTGDEGITCANGTGGGIDRFGGDRHAVVAGLGGPQTALCTEFEHDVGKPRGENLGRCFGLVTPGEYAGLVHVGKQKAYPVSPFQEVLRLDPLQW